jgi:hypothetical protein
MEFTFDWIGIFFTSLQVGHSIMESLVPGSASETNAQTAFLSR